MTSGEVESSRPPPPPASDGGHGPKRLALAALAANRLSREGRRRMKQHIARCDVCRAEWPRVKDAVRAVREARGEPPPLDWERLEKTLSHVALEESRQLRTIRERERWQKRLGRAWIPVAVVLAAAAAYWLGLRAGRTTEPPQAPAPVAERRQPDRERPPARPVERAVLTVRSTALVGRVSTRRADGSAPIDATLASAWAEGDAAELDAGATWVARLCAGEPCPADRGGTIRVEEGSRLALRSIRDGFVELGLDRGATTVEAVPLREGERFALLAGNLAVRVRGTRFRVSIPDANDRETVDVAVARGVVEIVHLPTGRRNVLEAPAQARFVRGAMQDRRALDGELEGPHGSGATLSGWVAVSLPSMPRGARSWRFADGPGGGATGALLLREGPATLEWTFADGRIERVALNVVSGLTVEPPEAAVTAPRTTTASGTLPREAISRVVSAGVPSVRRCYEHRLRRRPQLEARVVVRLRIGVDGTVDDARITSSDSPPELRDCVLPAVRAWRFPEPTGGPVTVQVPMTFAAR
ncbi:MAG: TonB family protein [Deltaproteobacteria bacterium]|nr:TonB family protein [Deltaproteobacteria bacterium]